jgi:hypothetical protein
MKAPGEKAAKLSAPCFGILDTNGTSKARPVRSRARSIFGDGPCNDHGDIVSPASVQSILNKFLGHPAR